MINYERLYAVLFNGITDAILNIEQQNYGFAKFTLIEAQQKAENIFIESDGD
jgi:hypothetical protein